MKPQRPQSKTLRTPKEYPFKDITGKIISCALKVHSMLGSGLLENIHITQVLTYLRAENKRVGLLINFNVEKLKDVIKRVILLEITERRQYDTSLRYI